MTQLHASAEVAANAESEKITSAVQPRGMTKRDAAVYCGCGSLAAFDDWVRRGIVPGPIPGTHRWDRKAIDMKLDLASGLQTTMTPTTALEEWRAKKNARAS
jgi:hypothetical protein